MTTRTSYFLIGFFTLLGVALLAGGLILMGVGGLEGDVVLCETLFDQSISGLSKGAPVRFRGVKVGEVERIGIALQLYDSKYRYVVVQFKIYSRLARPAQDERDLATEIKESVAKRGLRVQLAIAGISGTTYLDTDFNVKWITEYPPLPRDWESPERVYIPSRPSTLSSIVDSLTNVLENLKKSDIAGLVDAARKAIDEVNTSVRDLDTAGISSDFRSVLGKVGKAVDTVNADLPAIMASVKKAAENLDRAAADASALMGDPALKASLENVNGASADLRELLADPKMKAIPEQVEHALTEARQAFERIQGSLGPIDELVEETSRMLRAKDRDVSAIMRNVALLSAHIERLAGTLERYPSFALFGEPPEKRGPRK